MKTASLRSAKEIFFDTLQNCQDFTSQLFSPAKHDETGWPKFTPNFFKSFRFFNADQTKPMAADSDLLGNLSAATTVPQTQTVEIAAGTAVLTVEQLVKLGVRAETIATLQSYGLSLETIRDLFVADKQYYDQEIAKGDYKGYRLFVTHLPATQRPSLSQVKNNITENGRYDNFLRYPNIGFSFMVKYNGEDYLFNQSYRIVNSIEVRMCYLVKMTSATRPDGCLEVRRTLVDNADLREQVMQYAVSSGALQRALGTVQDKSKLINGETDAQTYADLVIAGGAVYGFSGVVSGSMGQYEVVDCVTPDGFAIRLTCYKHSSGVSFIGGIEKNKRDYQEYLATNYKAYGVAGVGL